MSVGLDRLTRLRDVGAVLQRVRDGRVEIEGLRRQRRLFARHELRRPEVRLRRVHDEHAQRVLGRTDLTFSDDHLFFGSRDFGLGLDDVDRRDRAEIDFLLVVPERGLGQLVRLLRDLELPDGIHQVEVRVPHPARHLRHRLPQLQVCNLLVLQADGEVLPERVELEVAQQRLRVAGGEPRIELRVEEAGRVARRRARRVQPHGVASAAPRYELADAGVGADAVGGQHRVTAVEEVGRAATSRCESSSAIPG